MRKLGIVAGGGALPARIAAQSQAAGRAVFILAIEGEADPAMVSDYPHAWSRLGAAGTILRLLKEQGVEDLVMAGSVRRPSVTSLRPDWQGARLLARIGMRALGDDGLLSAVIGEFEAEGFTVVSVDSLLGSAIATPGPIGKLLPDSQAEADIRHGLIVAHALGRLDVGQAVVVQQGLVLGLEAIEGTDALLRRCGPLRREGPGGVLIKAAKPQQDRRADLPTIGPRTVELAAEAGLRGIAIETGAALLIDRDTIRDTADRLDLFVQGVAAG